MTAPALIALDWGTSNLRASLLDAQGAVLEHLSAPGGVMKVPAGQFSASLLALCGPWLAAHYGLALRLQPPQTEQALVLVGIVLAGTLASAIPGWRAYRLSITDGLQPRA